MAAEVVITRPLTTDLGRSWAGVLARIEIRHLDPAASVRLALTDGDPPSLYLEVTVRDSDDQETWREGMAVHTMALPHWPGEAAAAQFIARAWMGFVTHEALELVRFDGVKVLDPHAEPYPVNPANRLFREGCPTVATAEAIRVALSTVTGGP